MPTKRRAPLTADLDCACCQGTGRVRWREIAPGERADGAGRVQMITREELCDCVEARPGRDEEAG